MRLAKKLLQNSAVKYALVGGVNTLVCWVVIVALMGLGTSPEVANVLGYGIGFINSYLLNKKFTFASANSHKQDLTRFSLAMGAAYLINFAVLVACYRLLGLDKYLSQVVAAVCYTGSGYVLTRCWAFRQAAERDKTNTSAEAD